MNDLVENGFGRGMRRVQGESLIAQLLGFEPIVFNKGMRVLDECIGQNGAGKRIRFVEFVGSAQ